MDALFTLLKAGLWGLKIDNLGHFPLSTIEWRQLFEEARKQTITGIVYRGITMLPDKFMPPIAILTKWVAEVDRIERNNQKMNNTLKTLIEMFEQQGLTPIVLKGQSVAALYETPDWRECGDIDLYFKLEDKEKAKKITSIVFLRQPVRYLLALSLSSSRRSSSALFSVLTLAKTIPPGLN